MFNVMSTRGTHLNPAFELPFGTHPLHFIILTLLIMHVMPPTIDCLCIILMVVVAVNWFRSRSFRAVRLPLIAWAQLVFIVVLCFTGIAINFDFHPDWF